MSEHCKGLFKNIGSCRQQHPFLLECLIFIENVVADRNTFSLCRILPDESKVQVNIQMNVEHCIKLIPHSYDYCGRFSIILVENYSSAVSSVISLFYTHIYVEMKKLKTRLR